MLGFVSKVENNNPTQIMSSVPLKKCPRELKVVILFSAASRCSPAAGRKMLFTFVVQLRLISSPGLRANSCRHMWVVLIVSKAEAGVNAHIRYGPLFEKQMEASRPPQKNRLRATNLAASRWNFCWIYGFSFLEPTTHERKSFEDGHWK